VCRAGSSVADEPRVGRRDSLVGRKPCRLLLEALDRHFEEGAVGTLQRGTSWIDHRTNVEGVGTDRLPAWSTAWTADENRPR
jgi:hypothetical protein